MHGWIRVVVDRATLGGSKIPKDTHWASVIPPLTVNKKEEIEP